MFSLKLISWETFQLLREKKRAESDDWQVGLQSRGGGKKSAAASLPERTCQTRFMREDGASGREREPTTSSVKKGEKKKKKKGLHTCVLSL